MIRWNRLNPEMGKIVVKVGKLENLANRAKGWAEGTTARNMARKLRVKHEITQYIVTPTPDITDFLYLVTPKLYGIAYELDDYLAFNGKLGRIVRYLVLTYRKEIRRARREALEGQENKYESWLKNGIHTHLSFAREIMEEPLGTQDYSQYLDMDEEELKEFFADEPEDDEESDYDIPEEAEAEFEAYRTNYEKEMEDYAEWFKNGDKGKQETKAKRKARKKAEREMKDNDRKQQEAIGRLMRQCFGGETAAEKVERETREVEAEAEAAIVERGEMIARTMVKTIQAM